MNQVNLIPHDRIERRRLRRRSWRWIAFTAFYAVLLMVAWTVANVVGGSDDRALRTELVNVRGQIASTEQALSTLREDLDQAAALYFANLEVGNQPDWSVLLALLAQTTGEEIVLRTCRVRATDSQPGDATNPTGASPTGMQPGDADVQVELNGIGRSQQHVSNFLLRMEDIALFENVKLLDTRREPFLDTHAISFRIDFTLDASGEKK